MKLLNCIGKKCQCSQAAKLYLLLSANNYDSKQNLIGIPCLLLRR